MSFLLFSLFAVSSTFTVQPPSSAPGVFEECPSPIIPTF
jgi:hypothetical protein